MIGSTSYPCRPKSSSPWQPSPPRPPTGRTCSPGTLRRDGCLLSFPWLVHFQRSSCRSCRQPSPLTAPERDGRAAPHTARLPFYRGYVPAVFRNPCPFPFAARFSHNLDAIMGRRRSLSTAGPLHSPPPPPSVDRKSTR